MRWWPVAATVSGAAFVLSLAALLIAPAVAEVCDGAGAHGQCDQFVMAARSLVVGSGAFLVAALVGGLYSALLTVALQRIKAPDDARPLVSVHARRRQ